MVPVVPYFYTRVYCVTKLYRLQVFNKKVPGKSIFGMPKRWFGGPKPGSPVSAPNAH